MTWATSVPILVFLGPSVLDLGPMYATDRLTDRRTDRQTDRRQTAALLNALMPIRGGGTTSCVVKASIVTIWPQRWTHCLSDWRKTGRHRTC